MTHKQVLVVRKDLNMRKGKIAAQCAHASLGAVLSLSGDFRNRNRDRIIVPLDGRIEPWINGTFTKICVYVNSEQELLALTEQCKEQGLIHCLITDSGLTEFHNVPTNTVLAVGPDLKEKIDAVTKGLPLL